MSAVSSSRGPAPPPGAGACARATSFDPRSARTRGQGQMVAHHRPGFYMRVITEGEVRGPATPREAPERPRPMHYQLEVVILPGTDIDRSLAFY